MDDGIGPLPPLPGLSGRNLSGTRYSWVYPNLTFAASIDAVWIFEAIPLEPALTRVNMTVCFPQASVEQPDFATKLSAYERRMEAGLAEDIPVIETQQRGLSSSLARAGRYSPLYEPSVHAFIAGLRSFYRSLTMVMNPVRDDQGLWGRENMLRSGMRLNG